MQWNWIQNMALPMYSTVFNAFFNIILKNIDCVTRNKVAPGTSV